MLPKIDKLNELVKFDSNYAVSSGWTIVVALNCSNFNRPVLASKQKMAMHPQSKVASQRLHYFKANKSENWKLESGKFHPDETT
ncbi:hypothetical protein PUN28_002072 [Cardiocondyla obscurior]|uniref:Ribosomal protein L31 n=1 Tax=Cardiocondyla obscurior TaxID=286306 RepID=A0AAW2GSN1_9HYME